MDEDELVTEEPPELFEQDGPDLFALVDVPAPAPVAPKVAAPASTSPAPAPDAGALGARPRRSEEEITESLMQVVEALRDHREPPTRPEATLALYRRYRPDTFADVIGQAHVTEPLQRALVNNRVNHAYLFSGPRGCGKTTSARILARCLNCAKGPTPTPCGECQSCRDLARGGVGSLDVIEIDAASHGGVNEARDLRERAFFAPVHSRYKIYIIDEAHMVTKEGFNALLKVVEEPPPHVKFIFATTEPDKVLGTIRSRTHHYPFRLVPPKILSAYLAELCTAEGVKVEPSVLPLVVRAGAGSVRDSLSVLDQLLGGAAEEGVSYQQATALLGYTPDTLLDGIVDAFAAGDAEGVFASIDKVIGVGQDPRRFAEDLLRRLRDLVIVAAVPDALATGLVDVAADQGDRLTAQAKALGPGELTRAAEVIANGLTEMRGTTAPRLHLELMCARVLLPGADVGGRGVHARLDRLERRLAIGGVEAAPDAGAATPPQVRFEAAAAPPTQSAAPADDGLTPRQRAMATKQPEAVQPASDWPEPTPAGRPAASRRPRPAATDADSGAPGAPTQPTALEPANAAAPTNMAPADAPVQPATAPRSAAAAPEAAPASAVPSPASHAASTPTDVPERSAGESHAAQATPAAPERSPADATKPSAPPAAGGLDTAAMRTVWPQVLNRVKDKRRFTWILLSQNAQVLEYRGDTLTLGVGNPGVRDSFGRGGSDEVLREALLAELGITPKIEVVVHGGSASPTPSEPSVSTPAPAAPPEISEARSRAMAAARENVRPTQSRRDDEPESEPSRGDADLDEGSIDPNELLAKHLGAELIGEESGDA